jgi:O-antigen ligase
MTERTPSGTVPRQNTNRSAVQIKTPAVVKWSFLVFAVTLPFDGIHFLSPILAPTKIAGLLLAAAAVIFPKTCFARPSKAMWWYLGYITIYAFNGFFITDSSLDEFLGVLLRLLQLILLFWLASSAFKDQKLAKNVFIVYSVTMSILSIALVLGIPGLAGEIATGERYGETRMVGLGYKNPNDLAGALVLAAIILIGTQIDNKRLSLSTKVISTALLIPLLMAMVRTGSRTAFAAFVVSVLSFLVPLGGSNKLRIIPLILLMLTLSGIGYLAATDPVLSARWSDTLIEGKTSGRDKIVSEAIGMIAERPLFGWQPVEYLYELGRREGILWSQRDPHNLFFRLILELGVLGAVPFLLGLGLCARAAWRARTGQLGRLPVALLLLVFAFNLAGSWIEAKSMWLILGLAVASELACFPRVRLGHSVRMTRFKTSP